MGAGGMNYAAAGVGTVGALLETAGKFLSKPKKVHFPGFTQQEQDFLQNALGAAHQGRDLMQEGAGQNSLMGPLLYDLAGVDVQTQDNSAAAAAANAHYQQTQADLFAAKQTRRTAKASGKKVPKGTKKQIKNLKQQLGLDEKTVGYYRTNPVQITGMTKRAQPGEADRNALEAAYAKKALAGVQGNLPDDPRLLRELAKQEQVLRERLGRQLGPGYDTSSPGAEALANFDQRRRETLYAAQNRDALAYGDQAMQAAAAHGNLDTQRMGQLSGIPRNTAAFGDLLLNSATDYERLMAPYTQQRMGQYAADKYNASIPSDLAWGLLVSGEGHKDVAAAMGASGLGGQQKSSDTYIRNAGQDASPIGYGMTGQSYSGYDPSGGYGYDASGAGGSFGGLY